MQLVDEHDDVRVLGELLHDRLEALFELAAVLRAGHDQRDVERENALIGQEVRHVAVDDLLRQPLDDGRLADARFADEHRVVLGAATQHLLDPLEFVLAADQRVELALHRRLGEVAAELGQQRRFLHAGQCRLLVEELDDILADSSQPHALLHQDGGGHRALFAQDTEQQVLGPDVVVQEAVGFFRCKLQHPLGFRAERNLDRGRDLLAEDRPAFDFLTDVFQGEMRARKNSAREPFALADQAQQKMLGLDGDAAELTGLVSGEEENSSSPFGVPFEHPAYLSKSRRGFGHDSDTRSIRHRVGHHRQSP